MSGWKRPEIILLAIVALLAPIMGGQVPTEPRSGASLVTAFTGDANSVSAARLILGLLIFGALALAFLKMRAVPLPRGRMTLGMAVLLASLAFAAVLSDFRMQSIEAFLLWGIAAAAFFATVAATGRRAGPTGVMAAMAIAGAVLGGRAVMDYFFLMDAEPTYRAFATWINPNSLAGIYAILGVLCAGLIQTENKGLKALGFASAILCGAGLALTQSKGGILAMILGLLAWAVVHKVWKGKTTGLASAAPLLLGFVLAFAWQTTAIRSAGGAAGGRLLSAGSEAEQSQGFRTLLWKSAVELAKDKPLTGWGPGTFRYESGRPKLQTPTNNAHQTFLQTAYEGGVLAIVAFLFIAFAWFKLVFRGAKSLTPEQNQLRAAVVGAVVAFGAGGMTESSLAFPGIAITVFILLGLGLQLSADGSSPELMPPTLRRLIVVAFCAVPLMLLGLFAANESRKSSILAFAEQGEKTAMVEMSHTLESTPISKFDGEALLLAGQYDIQDNERRGRLLEMAVEIYPASRAIRHYVRWLSDKPENLPTAITVLKRVFIRDPYNLLGWRLLLDLEEKAGNEMGARVAAEKLVAIEGTSYYQVNSLGDLVPLETSEARIWLAKHDPDPTRQIAFLKPAVQNHVAYATRTVPLIKLMAKAGLTYGGQSKSHAAESLAAGVEAAELWKKASEKLKDVDGAQLATEAVSALEAARSGLEVDDSTL